MANTVARRPSLSSCLGWVAATCVAVGGAFTLSAGCGSSGEVVFGVKVAKDLAIDAMEAEVFVDGGVRRGTDVLKALALGAKAALIGRPVLWGLAVDGEAGVGEVFAVLRHQLDRAMALSGCAAVGQVDRGLLTGD